MPIGPVPGGRGLGIEFREGPHMKAIDRREFLGVATAAAGAALTGSVQALLADAVGSANPPGFLRASDTVTLGKTGLKASRLALGTGTKILMQRELGEAAIVRLLRHGLDRGIRWWDTADMYKIHPYMGAALKEIERDRVVINTKTLARDAATVKADIERFRKELDTDYIDILLLHCLTDGGWPEKLRGCMDALSEAKQRGQVRLVGCSCHSLDALRASAASPWVDIQLARVNPYAVIMDIRKADEVPKVTGVLEEMHKHGKIVYGMKILGEGQFKGDRIDRSLEFALKQSYLTGFTIGFRYPEEIDDIIARIDRLRVPRV